MAIRETKLAGTLGSELGAGLFGPATAKNGGS